MIQDGSADKAWEYILTKEFSLKIDGLKGEKIYFAATVLMRRVEVCNTAENQFTFCYCIVFHPYLKIFNHTPRKINLSIFTPGDSVEINSRDLDPSQSLSVEMLPVSEKTSINLKLQNSLSAGKDCYPFRKMNKKIRVISMLFTVDQNDKNNRLMLKLELRRKSP
jgi:hypothetical protein